MICCVEGETMCLLSNTTGAAADAAANAVTDQFIKLFKCGNFFKFSFTCSLQGKCKPVRIIQVKNRSL